MARQIEDITVKLGIVGFEELNKLRSSFRELTKVTNATDTQLDDARKRLLELKTELGNTTRVNKGLTDAFGALLDEARRGSDVWKQLNTDLAKVRQESRLTDTQITALRDIIVDESKAHAQSANSIREHVKSLQDLRNQASLNGKVHQQLGADIQKLTDSLKQGEITNREHYKSLGQILAVKPDAVLKQWQAYTRILQEGTASADKLAAAQRRLNQLSGAPRILERRRVSESAAITQDPEYLRRFGFEGTSLPELPNTNAAYSQQIKELQQDLANLDRSSIEYLQTLMQLTGVQRQSTEVARGYAQALLMGVQTKTVANSTRNLQEVITALRAEMQQLDTTTSEGSAAYATNANQVRNLEQQLKTLAGAYRHVGDMATQAATAEQNAANARIRANYLNRGKVRQQEEALAELGQRVRQGVSGTPLLLPAAGQTSAPGTGAAISGGARRLAAGRTETVFGPAELRGAAQQAGLPSAATGVPAAVGLISDAYAAQARNAFKASESLSSYFVAISKATQGSNNSINSLTEQRQAWEALRTAIPRTYKLYGEATTEIQKLDRQLERSNAQRRRLSGMQVAQGVGAALSGGIFGGPEGLIGGLGGLAVGGVGGAFAGAAYGAYAGMFRQQLGLVAQYVAQLNLAKTTLAQASTGQADYNRMLTAARSISADYAVTLQDTLRGYAQVAVAARANGLSAKETEQVYRGVISAGVAFGKSQADLDAIVTATVQVLSKGKVSAEELGGQIGERLPGAVAKFAAATGRTLPELAKALEDGKVNIRDFVKFAQQQFTDYDSIARTIGDSPEKAGARLRIALDTIAESYGSFLQNSGATFQDAATHVLTWVTTNERSIKRFLAALSVFGKDLIAVLRPIAQTTVDIFKPVFSYIFQNAARGIAAIRASLEALQQTDFAGASARAQKAVEKLYPNPVERALSGAPAYQEALNVELKTMNNRFGSGYNQRVDAEAARLFKSFQPSQYGAAGPSVVDPNAGTGTDKDKDRESLMRKLQQNFDKTITQIGKQFNSAAKDKLYETLLQYEGQIQTAYSKRNLALAEELKLKQQAAAIDVTEEVLLSEKTSLQQKLSEASTKGLDAQNVQNRLDAVNAELKQIQYDRTKEATAELEKQAQKAVEIRDALQRVFSPGIDAPGVLDLGGVAPGFAFGEEDSFRSFSDKRGSERIKELNKDLQSLTEPLTQILTAAESIGTAFSSSFTGVINGTASAQQALASFFSSIADYFLDMAGKIIAKWIEMAILNTVLQLLPGGPKFSASSMSLPGLSGAGALGSASVAGGTDWSSLNYANFKPNAMGNAYAANGIVPFAMGGLVDKPTLFKFANGGAGRLGLMGEAGPEAIMPLRRLPSGRLGVESAGGGTTNVVVNVDASGSQVQGDNNQAEALGRAVSAAVQAELVRQKRDGGLLAGNRR